MFKPINIYYGGGDDKSSEESSSSPISSTTPGVISTTSMRITYSCPDGWHRFTRPASSYNSEAGFWCVKLFPSDTHLSINNASKLCKDAESELTAFENEEERAAIMAEAKLHIVDFLKKPTGAIALAGNRNEECRDNNTVIRPPCNDNTKSYFLPSTAGTNPAFLWKSWAKDEPSFNTYVYANDFENCLQLFVTPSDSSRNGKINDFFCQYDVSPNDPQNTDYMNFGALCGRAPDMEAVL